MDKAGFFSRIYNRIFYGIGTRYVPLIDRINEYNKNLTKYEKGYFIPPLIAFLLIFIPLIMINIYIKEPNKAFHFSLLSLSFVLAYWGAGFLYFESNHRDETLARHVLNLTKKNAPKRSTRLGRYVLFLAFCTLFMVTPIYIEYTIFPYKFVFLILAMYFAIFSIAEMETYSWYFIQGSVDTLLQSKNRKDDNKAVALFRDWYRQLGFRCLKWAALAGLIDLMKDAFQLSF